MFKSRLVPLSRLEAALGLESPLRRRKLLDVLSLRKVLVGEVDCPALLGLFCLRTSGQTQSYDLFCLQACSTTYEVHSSI